MSCKKAQEFLELNKDVTVKELVDARKNTVSKKEALKIARESQYVWAAKGKKVQKFKMQTKDAPTDEELTKAIVGPSGNLRAPSFRMGKKLIVGFHEETYEDVF